MSIILYCKETCPFCHRAKQLLSEKGWAYEEIDLLKHPERRDEMIKKAGGRTTVPQIFIKGHHVGGCDDLFALDAQGKLEELYQK